RPARLSDALLRPSRAARHTRPRTLPARGGPAMDRRDSRCGRLHLRHPGIQLRPPGGAQERDRLGLSGVESQGGGVRELRQRRGHAQRPAAAGNGDRASACSDSLGDVDKGLAELEKSAKTMLDDLLWWTEALETAHNKV